MRTAQWTLAPGAPEAAAPPLQQDAHLVLVFGGRADLEDVTAADALRDAYPEACLVGCATGGEIVGGAVVDGRLAVTAVAFDTVRVSAASVELRECESAWAAGQRLGGRLAREHADAGALAHVLLFADGVGLNGSEFVRGLEGALPTGVAVTGGLAGDADRFERTPLWCGTPLGGPGAVAVGLYGAGLRVGYGAAGGWDPFGPDRLVSRSDGHVLHALDGQSALALYRRYLGPHADSLPASGLRFPLSVHQPGSPDVIRTLLATDDAAGTLTFAGDVPEGASARLMRANPERLIEGAAQAARDALAGLGCDAELALVVSCVGRKWVLGQRVDEEVEAAADVLGGAAMSGFYSYGEVSPALPGAPSQLHNQTMTVTLFAEA